MEDFVYYNDLFDIYRFTITETNQTIFTYYYAENLSMQEIADIKNISKSRVGTIIKNIEQKLDKYEEALCLYKKYNKLNELLELEDINIIKMELDKIIKGE